MSGQATPLPKDGVVGKLTKEQTKALKQFWSEFFELLDEAPKEGSGGKSATDVVGDKEGKDIPKDDSAKEKARQEQERRDAKAAFNEYGSVAFLAAMWRSVAMDHADGIMLRFLRARKWDPKAGVAMACACIKWRLSSDVEKIFEKGEEGMKEAEGFIMQMETAKTYTQGTDKYGRPVVYVHVAKHRTNDQSPKALEDFVLFQMESVRCLFSPPVDKIVMVFNMTGFGLRNMDWRCILFIVKCLEAYYPESLNVILIHNAPWVFQGIWKLLAPMLDPVVRAKVQMTKNTDDLCVHIDKKHLVKELGGTSSWEWKYPPIKPGENDPQKDKEAKKEKQAERDAMAEQFLQVTREWAKSDDPKIEKKREYLALKMRAQYFLLDPHIRGRGAYHRNGNIVGNGLVTFEYPDSNGNTEGEWEVSGYETCREECLLRCELLEKELKALGVDLGAQESESTGKRSRKVSTKSKKKKVESSDEEED